VMGLADGWDLDRRYGMAGTMRDPGRRCCFCAKPVRAAVSAMIVGKVLVKVRLRMRKRLQVIAASRFLPIILERPGTGEVCGEGIC
jgi:hypothetical protein